jgi:multidrug efflux pump subunit AcrA (membrane-fusion protein)
MFHQIKKIFPVLICLTIFLSACASSGKGYPTPTPLPLVVDYDKAIFTVERGSIIEEMNLYGEVTPAKQDDLFFRSSGFVTRVAIKEGEPFKKGDLLAELQVEDLLNQLEQARIDLEVALANQAQSETQKQYDLEKAQSEVKIWEKKVELADLDYQSATGSNKERALLNLDIAKENLALAQQTLQLQVDYTNPYIDQAVKRSELSVERLAGLVEERQIIAPYDGVVLNSTIRPGQQVDAYDTIFTIGDPTNMIISAPYDYDLATMLDENSIVNFYLSTSDEEGIPIQYLPDFQPERGVQNVNETVQQDYLYFSLPEGMTSDQIPSGRNFILKITIGQKDDALLLPPSAIREYKGMNFVIVLDGDRRRRVEIPEIGLKSQDYWEVIADLQEGDQVLGP